MTSPKPADQELSAQSAAVDLQGYRSLTSSAAMLHRGIASPVSPSDFADFLSQQKHGAGKAVIAYLQAHGDDAKALVAHAPNDGLPSWKSWEHLARLLDQRFFFLADEAPARAEVETLAQATLGIKAGSDFAEFFKTFPVDPRDPDLMPAQAPSIDKIRQSREAQPASPSAPGATL